MGSSCSKPNNNPNKPVPQGGDELQFLIHAHLRGYDKEGRGFTQESSYLDQYGAPTAHEDSWKEGYRCIEEALDEHNEQCKNHFTDFPKVDGYMGGAHLYKNLHHKDPHNWTGWIPKHQKFRFQTDISPSETNKDTNDFLTHNRKYISVRGNEIQNNLWDYDPMTVTPEDTRGPYQGGYWYQGNEEEREKARYLHIIALKTHCEETDKEERYNYIVHPLAYRNAKDQPGCDVDNIQWSVNNIVEEEHFNEEPRLWGKKVHGIEVYNDFTYYFSYKSFDKKKGLTIYNGGLYNFPKNKEKRYYWCNTYPLEFGEFILDTALNNGVHLHVLAATDAFYHREIENTATHKWWMLCKCCVESQQKIRSADPKSNLLHETLTEEDINAVFKSTLNQCLNTRSNGRNRESDKLYQATEGLFDVICLPKVKKASDRYLAGLPYRSQSNFGYVALLNTEKSLTDGFYSKKIAAKSFSIESAEHQKISLDVRTSSKNRNQDVHLRNVIATSVSTAESADGQDINLNILITDKSDIDLNACESDLIDHMQRGQLYSHTGIHDVFDYSKGDLFLPYTLKGVKGQPNVKEMWYNEESEPFDLIFTFPPEKKLPTEKKCLLCPGKKKKSPPQLIWRYTVESIHQHGNTPDTEGRIRSTGYFKLHQDTNTILNLQKILNLEIDRTGDRAVVPEANKDAAEDTDTTVKVKWVRFTIFNVENPMRRAWFSPIRGEHFSDGKELLLEKNRIAIVKKTEQPGQITYTDTGNDFHPSTAPARNDYGYIFQKRSKRYLNSYFLEVCSREATNGAITPFEHRSTRYMQNVHGYIPLQKDFRSQLNLSESWDLSTVIDGKVHFYSVDGETCQLKQLKVDWEVENCCPTFCKELFCC